MNLTLEMIYDLPNKVIENSTLYDGQVARIPDKICKEYKINEIKPKLFYMFTKFNSIKFYYNVATEELIKITSSYDIKDYESQRNTDSKIETVVMEKYDKMIWASKFYDSVISLSKGLTKQEGIYLAYGIMSSKTIDDIALMMDVCPRTVNPIGKSCIIKSWNALETFYEEVRK